MILKDYSMIWTSRLYNCVYTKNPPVTCWPGKARRWMCSSCKSLQTRRMPRSAAPV
uniref:Uncharacterized protein n=1 Tax=Arundo donax TaxID=35708 RepID=A0A0A9C7W0_ARUDO